MRGATTEAREPLKECDLVMKGGITSGVVYPPAVLELSRTYRFRSIGGASAGAIAAAVTAAAEYARDEGGFDRLQKVNEWLASGTNLVDLFQPTRETKPLLTALLEVLRLRGAAEQSKKRRLLEKPPGGGTGSVSWTRALSVFAPKALRRALPVQYWLFGATGAFCGLTVGAFLARGITPHVELLSLWPLGLGLVVGYATGWLSGLIGSLVVLGFIMAKRVPREGYGVCGGRKGACERPEAPALTDWLHSTLNNLAGLDPEGPPLTIGQLTSREPSIELRMVTTDISVGEPVVVPFDGFLLVREEEMARLFPDAVVKHLRERARTSRRLLLDPAAYAGYFLLPRAEDLPVVLAARLSLSFPILLSAVPLYAVRRSAFANRGDDGVVRLADPGNDLERHWFSDGGISSNFPIHFFDTWFPTRPTFGINLTSIAADVFQGGELAIPSAAPETRMWIRPECQSASASGDGEGDITETPPSGSRFSGVADPGQAVYLPRPNAPQYAPVTPIRNLFGFLGAVWTTAQNYRDNMQARLPSYRERIVQIRFAPDEGGLNLAMGPQAISSIRAKGRLAGERLRDEFSLVDHRWVRLRVLLEELEANLKQGARAFPSADAYREFLHSLPDDVPYKEDAAWRSWACKYLSALAEMIEEWQRVHESWSMGNELREEIGFFSGGAPKPLGALRVTPRV